jgi:hypothetical protein
MDMTTERRCAAHRIERGEKKEVSAVKESAWQFGMD